MTGWLLRLLVALGLLGSAWVHLDVWLDWARNTDVIGPLFLVNVAAGAVIAIAVLVWHHWLPALAAVGFGVVTLVAYVLSLTVGLFGVREQFATQAELWGVVTEAACVVFGSLLLLPRFARAERQGEPV
ncbi:hypothetical protein BAY61_20135 [Prauserella marina]|uniref:Uncharacterized protein n=1 Tax=Prauserella marina TaxID=530584 RepID=A0A222VT67_9PSEU|nr:hypothetical protein [Prauserella marina]ASR36911.1 hypothetical protein BAY61_20135 [Prauserella marina]PWV80145.1 hypothetical protein DES30_103235 [Prauserella marina]SDD48147.1 hypothetical protein SAMN05421630_10920 [Prauserella marina]